MTDTRHAKGHHWVPPFLIVLGPIVLLVCLNFTGFCYSQGAYYSDQRLIEAAIRYDISRHSASNPETSKRYDSMADFRHQNPDCCKVYRYGHPFLDPIWVRIFGFYIVMVEVWYRANETTGVDNFYDSLISFDACGRIMDFYGITEAHGPIIAEPAR